MTLLQAPPRRGRPAPPPRLGRRRPGRPGSASPTPPPPAHPCGVILRPARPQTGPPPLAAGDRRFDVLLQGEPALLGVDIAAEAGGPFRSFVREIRGVEVYGKLTVNLRPIGSRPPILAGLEAIAEDPPEPEKPAKKP